jgi:selenide,water dikinase
MTAAERELLLVGAGHAHVEVLRGWALRPLAGVRLRVLVDRPEAVYSGMVPGLVAGRYAPAELTIDVAALAAHAGAELVAGAATRVDAPKRRIERSGGPPLPFDVASLDVGSTVAGLDLPGVPELALPTRPIGAFVAAVDALVSRARGRGRARVVVVGAGAGGVELACAFRARLAREGIADSEVTLVEAAPRVLPGWPDRVARTVASALVARGVALRTDARVAAVTARDQERCMRLADGEDLACDELVWVAGAAAPAWLSASPVPTDAAGFVRVAPSLQVTGHPELFAAGDCAAFDPPLAKAGVYAVRQGPLLDHNLRARLTGGTLRPFRPQRDFLVLLNLGDGTALGTKWGRVVAGAWVLWLKDRIDRRFVRRFQVAED